MIPKDLIKLIDFFKVQNGMFLINPKNRNQICWFDGKHKMVVWYQNKTEIDEIFIYKNNLIAKMEYKAQKQAILIYANRTFIASDYFPDIPIFRVNWVYHKENSYLEYCGNLEWAKNGTFSIAIEGKHKGYKGINFSLFVVSHKNLIYTFAEDEKNVYYDVDNKKSYFFKAVPLEMNFETFVCSFKDLIYLFFENGSILTYDPIIDSYVKLKFQFVIN